MFRSSKIIALGMLLGIQVLFAVDEEVNETVRFRAKVHQYLEKEPQDPFSKIIKSLEAGEGPNDYGNEMEYIEALLAKLKISKHSQQLVFSTTSLQLSRISPRNPRAIYFNEDLYLGYVPGGQIEIIGIDPEIGAIPYIFSPPTSNDKAWRPTIIRSRRCMNCHASPDIGGVPGLLISSVIPGPGGGSIDAFRQTQTGHSIPYDLRFGGWHLTGDHTFPTSWANSTGVMSKSVVTKVSTLPGTFFNWNRYLVPQSEVIANLVLEHQVGFINRCLGATYRLREFFLLEEAGNPVKRKERIAQEAVRIVEYALFSDEAPLPKPISFAQSMFAKDFQGRGDPLRQLNLKDRLLQRRCSYMIGSLAFQGLPEELKSVVFSRIKALMTMPRSELPSKFTYFGEAERKEIHEFLNTRFPEYAGTK
tara:strand:- start:29 stop:1285 length:1257 start_codon:yes stop_codon:yes gene_type:complete